MKTILKKIISSGDLHARWLNTLSYLENCGARKIAACEHPTTVKEEMLKHASEEFRHAHYLKSQIKKVSAIDLPDYSLPYLLGGFASRRYLDALDVYASRYLTKTVGCNKKEVIAYAYLLVTYAIELRAETLYPCYHEVLRKANSNVYVKSIILEEEEHLNEMKLGLQEMPSGYVHAQVICEFEERLFHKWLQNIEKELQY